MSNFWGAVHSKPSLSNSATTARCRLKKWIRCNSPLHDINVANRLRASTQRLVCSNMSGSELRSELIENASRQLAR